MKIYLKEKNNLYKIYYLKYKIYNCKIFWIIYYSSIYNLENKYNIFILILNLNK